MKKKTSALLAAVMALSALTLSGCGAPSPKGSAQPHINQSVLQKAKSSDEQRTTIEIDLKDIFGRRTRSPIGGVRRYIPTHIGKYTVEYVHYPQDKEKDESLDYSVELRGDNTFNMSVTTKGVSVEHYGNYYIRCDGDITFFFDEPIDDTAHNVYVSDSLYGEFLCGGKIMIYDNCNVIVLSKSPSSEADEPSAQ